MNLFSWLAGAKTDKSSSQTTQKETRVTDTAEAINQQQADRSARQTQLLDEQSLATLRNLFSGMAGQTGATSDVDLATILQREASRTPVDVDALMAQARTNTERELAGQRTGMGQATGSTFNTAVQQALGEARARGEGDLAATEAQLQSAVGQSEANRLASLMGARATDTQSLAQIANILRGAEATETMDTQMMSEMARGMLTNDMIDLLTASQRKDKTGSSLAGLIGNLTGMAGIGTGGGAGGIVG